PVQQKDLAVSKTIYGLMFVIFAVTFAQMFLGTQVREEIDFLRKAGVEREDWSTYFSIPFFIHRSFSWLVLVLIAGVYWFKRKDRELRIIHWSFYILVVELVSGILLAYFNMPGLIQTAHLLFASVLFGVLLMAMFRMKSKNH